MHSLQFNFKLQQFHPQLTFFPYKLTPQISLIIIIFHFLITSRLFSAILIVQTVSFTHEPMFQLLTSFPPFSLVTSQQIIHIFLARISNDAFEIEQTQTKNSDFISMRKWEKKLVNFFSFSSLKIIQLCGYSHDFSDFLKGGN